MGLAVIAVVFVASLFGVPTLFNHGEAHAHEPHEQQVASVQPPAPDAGATGDAAAPEHP
jgi:hypothetical protein